MRPNKAQHRIGQQISHTGACVLLRRPASTAPLWASGRRSLQRMHALRQEILPPSGVEFATCLKFTPSTLSNGPSSQSGRTLFNVVVARSSLLRIFEVREEPAPVHTQKEDERQRRASVRKGTEAVEGEVEMDASGEGFVNVGSVKVNTIWVTVHCRVVVNHNAIFLLPNSPAACIMLREHIADPCSCLLFLVFWSEWCSPSTDNYSLLPCS